MRAVLSMIQMLKPLYTYIAVMTKQCKKDNTSKNFPFLKFILVPCTRNRFF